MTYTGYEQGIEFGVRAKKNAAGPFERWHWECENIRGLASPRTGVAETFNQAREAARHAARDVARQRKHFGVA